jgi:F-type H+-transporting ATPase subunit gamma
MAQRRAILKRKKAAQTIGKITRAMAMVASLKLQKLRKRMLAAAPYAQKLREMVAVLAAHVGELQHPLLRPPTVENSAKRIVLLVITSNRGLVGAYNSNVLRMASDFIRRREGENIAVEVHVTGRKGVAYFTSHGRPLAQRYDQSGDLPTLADVEAIAARFADRFTSGQIDSVHVAYTSFVSAGVHRPELLTLLPMAALTGAAAGTGGQPLTSPGKTGSAVMYDFSPDPNILLGELLPPTLKACLFGCFLNAATSENAARKMATMRATENADQMFKILTLRYNRARQDDITNELMIIVGAAEAIRTSANT